MKNFLRKSIIEVNREAYLRLLIVLVPSLNFLSGITFDLHAPSLPAMASYYASSIAAVKNTIASSMFGFSIGGLLLGALLDIFGRRSMIFLALLIYTIASFSALIANTMNEILLI